MRYLGGARNRFLAWRGFMTTAGSWAMNGYSMFSVIEKASGRWVGKLGPWRPEGWPGTEVGWSIVRDAWGRGYATEGASAAMDWAVDRLGWTQIVHSIDPDNLRFASRGPAPRLVRAAPTEAARASGRGGSRHLGADGRSLARSQIGVGLLRRAGAN